IDFPTVIALGYGLPVRDRLTLEANVEWVEHSRNRSLDLDIANNNFLLLTAAGTTSLPQAWDDTWTFSLGGDWMLSPEWTLRSGYTYLPTPVPSETLAPSLAEGDKHVIAIGVGYADDGRRLDVAYAYNHADDRTISSAANPIQGTYEFDQHLVLVTYGRDL
ncbi:MAG: outer membrane protein transport protein, partial [Verrucomicrobia bacterium]|nr:outer membrane protein transport protein [Verrucomicrobiota bacterium]